MAALSPILPRANGGSTLWLINPDGRNARPTQVSGVLRFDWYLDSRRVIYTRNGSDGRIEMVATNLDTGKERLLLKANATELSVASGRAFGRLQQRGRTLQHESVRADARPPDRRRGIPSRGRGASAGHVRQGKVARSRRRVVPGRPVDRVHEGLRSRKPQRDRQLPLKRIGHRLACPSRWESSRHLMSPDRSSVAPTP